MTASPPLPIRAIWVFHLAARNGSISKAAAELSVTPSAVTQQIQSLEIQLGVSLLAKVGRRIVLTEAGERYFSTITGEIERIADATGTIRGFRSVTTLVGPRDADACRTNGCCRACRFLDDRSRTSRCVWTEPTNRRTSTVSWSISKFGTATASWPGLFVEGLSEETFVPACAPALRRAGSLDRRRPVAAFG